MTNYFSDFVVQHGGSIGIAEQSASAVDSPQTEEEKKRELLLASRPPLDEILNLHDFEVRHLQLSPGPKLTFSRPLRGRFFLRKPGHIILRHLMMRLRFAKTGQPTSGKHALKSYLQSSFMALSFQCLVHPSHSSRCHQSRLVNHNPGPEILAPGLHRTSDSCGNSSS
jgi:hypothetical protein